jgi:uncharacterized lipoprotein YddW (UPF0748 family)
MMICGQPLMTHRMRQFAALTLLLLGGCANTTPYTPLPEPAQSPARLPEPRLDMPPTVEREFRGLWVTSVGNRDWPSRPGLTSGQQQAELLAIFDRAAQLHLNAVLLQVRPDCDALYDSKIEPWSEYLTGQMGRAPKPYYDPLAFAVTEAHKRGLELHAWINPFRAAFREDKSPVAANHVTRTRPELVKRAGSYLMLDPSDPKARGYTLSVILDIVGRYDVDGLHMDDYFYPYPEKGYAPAEFPDDAQWQRYQREGGKLPRGDWRRENINTFVREVYLSIKQKKPWVKFGVSPFGIWRPGHPTQIGASLDPYATLYADSQKWFASGWVDYFSPQLYWPTEKKEYSFAALLNWWNVQNAARRHLWPGMRAGTWDNDAGNPAGETTKEIELTRRQPGATGNVLFRAGFVMANTNGVASELARTYATPALVPASPWLGTAAPRQPGLTILPMGGRGGLAVNWNPGGGEPVWLWALQVERGDAWTTEILPGTQTSALLREGPGTPPPRTVALTPVSRLGNLGPAAVGRMEGR